MPAGEEFRKRASSFREAHGNLPIRWILPENLHVTLVPPWYCEDADRVCKKLYSLLEGVGAFNVCFNTASVGPTARRPRLVWVSGGVHEALGELKEKLLCLSGSECDSRETRFLLHVTLAHIKKGQRVSLSAEAIDWRVTLDSVCLFESILRPSGAEYRELCEFKLSTG